MTDLTDKWKKGELTQDFYYVRSAWSDETEIRYVQNPECGDVYEEIIAPVPSYDEWKASYCCMAENEVLRLKLAKMEEEKRWYSENLHAATDKINELKELLKEVLRHELSLKEISELSRKISEALK